MIKIPLNKLTTPINFNTGTKSMLEKHKEWFFSRIVGKSSYDLNGKSISVGDVLYKFLGYSKTEIEKLVTADPDTIEEMANVNGAFYKDFLRRRDAMYACIEAQEKKRMNKKKIDKKKKKNFG